MMNVKLNDGRLVSEISISLGLCGDIMVKVGELVNEDGSLAPYFWECWNDIYSKKSMRSAGFSPTKINGKWTVRGELVNS